MSDMEGATGVVGFDNRKQLLGRLARHRQEVERYRRNLTADIAAAVWGAHDAGATLVTVCDGHGNNSVIAEGLPPMACLAEPGHSWMPKLDSSYDALLMIGFHARANTPKALLCHTFSRRVDEVLLNGRVVGEIELCALAAAAHGVPAVFISGDDAAVREAQAALPAISGCPVKFSEARLAGRCLPPVETLPLIRSQVCRALQERDKVPLPALLPPFRLVRRYRLPGLALLRRLRQGGYNGAATSLMAQSYSGDDFLQVLNDFFGFPTKREG